KDILGIVGRILERHRLEVLGVARRRALPQLRDALRVRGVRRAGAAETSGRHVPDVRLEFTGMSTPAPHPAFGHLLPASGEKAVARPAVLRRPSLRAAGRACSEAAMIASGEKAVARLSVLRRPSLRAAGRAWGTSSPLTAGSSAG